MTKKCYGITKGRTDRRTDRCNWLSIPCLQLLIVILYPNMNFLSYTVVEISLTKNVERKKNG